MKKGRGIKRNSWLTFKRRLLLVRLLLQKPRTKHELIHLVQINLEEDGYPTDTHSALKHDLDCLKTYFECRIRFNRSDQRYELSSLGSLAILDLTDESFQGLQFLDKHFPKGDALPEHTSIRTLIEEIQRLMPTERYNQLKTNHQITVERTLLPAELISEKVINMLEKAAKRQEIEFEYRSNQPDLARYRHRVAPYKIIFSTNGHVYLDATTLEVNPPDRAARLPKATKYRIDRIIPETLKILPQRLPPQRIGVQTFTVKYWLHPNVTRRKDMATHFPNSHVEHQADGSAIITGTATNVWEARQTLLRYGSACIVLEPIKLRDLFKTAIQEMAENYQLV